MADLVTLEHGVRHLKLGPYVGGSPLSEREADVQAKLDAAEAIVLTHIARADDADWTAEIAAWTDVTVPRRIQAAILLQLGELWRFRGDDAAQDIPKREPGFLSPTVDALLKNYRDPALA